jgi:hypothetical protein
MGYKYWEVVNQEDGNDSFDVVGDCVLLAASRALEELGYALVEPHDDDEIYLISDLNDGNNSFEVNIEELKDDFEIQDVYLVALAELGYSLCERKNNSFIDDEFTYNDD